MKDTWQSFMLLTLFLLVGLASQESLAAKRQVFTAVFVTDMHCATCAKKIASRLYAVPGVVSVKTDIKKNLALVYPQANRQTSPKALWEAVQKAKFKPVKIVSPQRTYTKKPRS